MPRITVGVYTPEMLRDLRQRQMESLGKIEGVIAQMIEKNVPELKIKGHAEITRSIKYLFRFALNAEAALHDFLADRGDYGQEIAEPPSVSGVSGSRKKATRKRGKRP